ncbi:peptide chain release factor N(5)-glutamine methyltransferase [Adhaeribacter sp. BT258]|uniref:Release factor glutamine methyltransferase n=1 Tax=Adhaeribacter terrigena TaxID=2793070 RepID=A0ABS1C493_9BACT|nr:peptide chain release factor N(5)-glutamine methyltransferase [Adhaeribacter terrigena]MBK0404177.1 peptide chain release factor N(5)-glutamine methyltransferase [Adhaeribacter terrigena]
MKKTQELINHIRTTLASIYEEPEASAIAFAVAGNVLGLSRLELSMQRHDLVPHEAEEKTEKIVQRLLNHEPLQYVLGVAYFMDLELKVTPAVLIPRPETEELVGLIIKENQHLPELHILDIGTGSGCIAISLAEILDCTQVYGLDISEKALEVAHENALKYSQPVQWIHADIFSDKVPLKAHSLDIIVSNPPYVLENEKPKMRRNVLDHEPHLALFVPDNDALLYYKRIAEVGKKWLKPGGKLYFEINEQFADPLLEMLRNQKYQSLSISRDLFGKDRFVSAALPAKS